MSTLVLIGGHNAGKLESVPNEIMHVREMYAAENGRFEAEVYRRASFTAGYEEIHCFILMGLSDADAFRLLLKNYSAQ